MKDLFAWLTVALIFVGEVRLPVGSSELYTPLSIFPALCLIVFNVFHSESYASKPIFLLLSILALGVVNTFSSDYVNFARSSAAVFPLLAALIILIALNGINNASRLITYGILGGGAFLSIWVIWLVVLAINSGLPFYEAKLLIETPLGRSNYLAAFLLIFFAFSLSSDKGFQFIAFFSMALLSIYSRGCFVVLMAFVLAILFLKIQKKNRLFVLFFLLLLIAASAILLYYLGIVDQFLQQDDGFFNSESAYNRLALWDASIDLIVNHPVLGIGPNGFRSVVEANDLEDVWGPHNSILLLWLNYGFLGLILYLVYCYFIGRKLQDKSSHEQRASYAYIAFFVLLGFSLFEPLVGSGTFEVLVATLCIYAQSESTPHPALI